jgi:hypothetical protein
MSKDEDIREITPKHKVHFTSSFESKKIQNEKHFKMVFIENENFMDIKKSPFLLRRQLQ